MLKLSGVLMTLMICFGFIFSAHAQTFPSIEDNQSPGFSQPPPMTANDKINLYFRSTYGPKSFGYSLLGAGFNHASDTVPEWGQGTEGYSKRFVSGFAQKAVKRTIDLGFVTALHEDPRYFRSGQPGIWNRSLYAAEQVFVAHKDAGGTRFRYSNLISIISSDYVSRQWHPDSHPAWSDYMSSLGISIGIDIAKNAINEFWPDIKRRLFRKQPKCFVPP
jgi:hypothetical protein